MDKNYDWLRKISESNRIGLEKYKEQVKDLVGDEYIVKGNTYINNKTKIMMKHIVCNNEYEVRPNDFLSRGRRCPICANKKRQKNLGEKNKNKTIEEIKKEIFNIVGDEYIVLSNVYINNKEKIKIKHSKCNHIYEVRYNDFQQGYRCPLCSSVKRSMGKSKPVQEIMTILDYEKVSYDREVIFEECSNIYNLPFDFCIYLDNTKENYILIEYDGQQHFDEKAQFGGTKEERNKRFKETVERDNIKNNFCKEYNIKLYRISYLEDHKEKIKEILKENHII